MLVRVNTSPPSQLLAAFGIDEPLEPFPGGRGIAWGTEKLVLKLLDMSREQVIWQEQVLGDIREVGFRVTRPVRAPDGRLIIDGWVAWQRLEGEHRTRQWAEICMAGERFHRATASTPRPRFLPRRTDVFAQADRAAWDLADLARFRFLPPIDRIVGRLQPLHAEEQLIHGDLTGNVLFHPALPPGIIDLSPYWRPPLFSTAIVVVDALMWEGADWSILSVMEQQPDAVQYLLRAAAFRAVIDHLCNPRRPSPPPWWPSMMRVVTRLSDLAL
jgi:uncharacterized protein (TIGR02569 family)